ncbi:helix-turn-helix transcriptional regulator [Streptomyces sp. NPDC048242]|uniref:helix-turn-helix transcriptional regulator n=1 Tax=Streptomyces sp. NPDC048242 TaxID=3155026 RepID=UPI003417ADF7
MSSDATPNEAPTADVLATLPFGKRVQRARERTGRTRAYVADVMGHSVEWVKAIETGRIGMPALPKLLRLAQVLGVEDITELTGDDRIAAASYTKHEHQALPVVKAALTRYQIAPVDAPPEPVAVLAARLRSAWRLWHGAGQNRSQIVALLPALLADCQHAARTLEGVDRRRALVALAETYHLAQLFLAFQPVPSLVTLTGDRAMTAAQEADSPRAIATAVWYLGHIHRDSGDAVEGRVEAAEQAVSLLPSDDDPGHVARRGLLYLAVALSYAKTGQAGDAKRYWDKADKAAKQLGPDYTHPWLIFGQGIVQGYAITMHNLLVQPVAALEAASTLDLASIPSATRRSYHLIETARSHSLLGEGAAALGYLTKAFKESPETVQYNLHTRAVLPGLAKTGPRMIREDAAALARELSIPV